MAGEVTPQQAIVMQQALEALREEQRKKAMGDFRSTHGGWYPNPAGNTPGIGGFLGSKDISYQTLGAQNAPMVESGRPVNAPQFAYQPPAGYESLVPQPEAPAAPAGAPQPLSPAPADAKPASTPMQRPTVDATLGQKKDSADNRKANARFREFMTTFGRRG